MSRTAATRTSSRFWRRASTWRSGRRSEAERQDDLQGLMLRQVRALELLASRSAELMERLETIAIMLGSPRR